MLGGRCGQARRFGLVILVLVALGTAAAADAGAVGGAGGGHRAVPTLRTQQDVSDGLRVESTTTFAVDLDGEVVRVTHAATLTNQVPDRVEGNMVRQFYFEEFVVPILPEATDVTASRRGGPALPVVVEPAGGGSVALAVVDLVPDLFHGATQVVELTYELRPQPPRSGTLTQVNRAYATFPLFALGDPGITDIEVRTPIDAEVEVVGDTLERSTEGLETVARASDLADPVNWFATFIVRRDAALMERTVAYDDHVIRIQGWPGDSEWLKVTSDLAERGLPVLESIIGFGWSGGGRQLDIVETTTPYAYGYAGWYEHSESRIEVGDALDEHVTLHEMAHVWFNEGLFESRWINEALADEVAARAMEQLGLPRPIPVPVPEDHPAAVPLNQWARPDIQSPETAEQEEYGYHAAGWLGHQIAEELGPERLAAVLRAADEELSPYPDSTGRSVFARTHDWRTFLDMLEEVGGSTAAEGLFRELVVTPGDIPLLDERAAVRDDYDDLVALGNGWSPPAGLRRKMAEWQFESASNLMPQIAELYEILDRIEADLAAIEAPLPEALKVQFELSTLIHELEDGLADVAAGADALRTAEERNSDAGPLARIGLLGSHVEADIDNAHAALQLLDSEAVLEHAEDAADAVDGATRAGAIRVTVLVLVLATSIAAGIQVRRRRARRRDVGVDPSGALDPVEV